LKFLTEELVARLKQNVFPKRSLLGKRRKVGFPTQTEATMIKLKILSAVVILSTAIAAPVFAQDAGLSRPHHARVYDQLNFRGAYNQSNGAFYARPLTNEERRNLEDFGFSGRDPSRVGGEDPSLNPPS
jgi:hypothetical protein